MALEAVEGLHEKVVRSLDGAVAEGSSGPHGTMTFGAQEAHPARIAYAKKVKDLTARIVDEQREATKQTNDADALRGKNERERRDKDARREIETFLRTAQLELLTARK